MPPGINVQKLTLWMKHKIAMIGCGSMGGGMAMLFAERGFTVSVNDPSADAIDKLQAQAKADGLGQSIKGFKDYATLCASLDSPKFVVFSLPHGSAGDSVLDGLLPCLDNGDIILDAGNENYVSTERRQGRTATKGIRYIGCGVSGGYQAARRGPSMCPGADEQTLEMVMPILKMVAAKDANGHACVGRCGLGGSGHYVKMIHNGIEHGMMGAISEAWQIMKVGLAMANQEIADVFQSWNTAGELRGTFLVNISADICRIKDPNSGSYVLDTVLDKVVQDLTGEEGTGVWSNMEAIRLHIPAPTLNAAHNFRLASSFRGQRELFNRATQGGWPPQALHVHYRSGYLEELRTAVYVACLASFVQGIDIIQAANLENQWDIDYSSVWQIWRAGCIIQADSISDNVLKAPFHRAYQPGESINLLHHAQVIHDLTNGYALLKNIVASCVASDLVCPTLSSTLEYIKYQSNIDLPASLYEAQLDYFGAHMYDKKEEDRPLPTEGLHHYEWKPA